MTFMDAAIAESIREMERDDRIQRKAMEYLDQGRERMEPGRLVDFVPQVYEGEEPPITAPVHLMPFALAIEQSVARLVDPARAHEPQVEHCFSMPVRHGKTTLITAAIVWILLWYPKAQILVASHGEWLAAKTVSAARNLAVIAGLRRGPKWTQNLWTTAEGGRVKATGWSGKLTGDGFGWIFVDDPTKNRQESESAVKRTAVNDGFYSNIYTRKLPIGTSTFIVQARWNLHDLIGHITATSKHFKYTNLPALFPDGTALAPHMYSAELLQQVRDEVGPYVWESLYQGQPRPRDGAVFRTDPIILPAQAMKPPGPYTDAIGIDLARTATTRSDHHAAVAMRRHASDDYDILDAAVFRGPIEDEAQDERVVGGFVHKLARICRAFPQAPIVWYAGRSEEWLRRVIEPALAKVLGRRPRVHVLPIENRGKWERAQPFATAWNNGKVRTVEVRDKHDERSHGLDQLIAELMPFVGERGGTQRDDAVDAAVAAFDHLHQGAKPAPPARARTTGEGSEAERMGGLI